MQTIDWIQQIFEWAKMNPHLFGFLVLLVSLSESLAIVGLFVPGVAIMTGIGALIGAGAIPAFYTMFMAAVGAVIGDGLSYILGKIYSDRVYTFYVLRSYPEMIDRSRVFFKKYGSLSVIFGRFVGPVRPVIPVVAGMMDMPAKNFYIANIISAILWAPAYTIPGIFLGASVHYMPEGVAKRLSAIIVLLLISLWLAAKIIKFTIHESKILFEKHSKNFWDYLSNKKFTEIKVFLRHHNNDYGQVELFFLIIIFGLSFTVFTFSVLQHGFATSLNYYARNITKSLYEINIANIMVVISSLFATKAIVLPSIGLTTWFIFKKEWLLLKQFITFMAITMSALFALKNGLHVKRPEDIQIIRSYYSYPSGHVFRAELFWGYILIICFMQNCKKIVFYFSIISYFLAIFLISIARMYLGAHWLSDIIGAILLATFFLFSLIFYLRRFETTKFSRTPVLILIFTLATIGAGLSYYKKGQQELLSSHPKNIIKNISQKEWLKHADHNLLTVQSGIAGQGVAKLNVQWQEEKNKVEAELQKLNWHKSPEDTFFNFLFFLQKDPKIQTIPLLPSFHNNELPKIVYYREIDPKTLIVIRLWNSNYSVDKKTLWVGNVQYYALKNYYSIFTVLTIKNNWEQASAINNFYQNIGSDFRIKKIPEAILLY